MKGISPRFGPRVLGIAAVYLTVWLHERGHSAAAYSVGCKANWWRTGMSWFLWSSWGGDIDYGCVERNGPAAVLVTAAAGVVVNLVLLLAALLIGESSRAGRNRWLLLGSVFVALANYAEAFSYLVLNTAWLKSDMASVVVASGISRWVWLAVGTMAAAVAGRGVWRPTLEAAATLRGTSFGVRSWLTLFVAYTVIIGTAMALARIVLT